MTRRIGSFLCLATISLLVGCAVGPDFQQPKFPAAESYLPEELPAQFVADGSEGNPAQRLTPGGDIAGEWWAMFQCRPLDDLIARAIQQNPNLTAAQAALKQARETVYAQQASFFPTIIGTFSPSRNKTPTAALSPASASGNPYYSLHTAQLSISYNPDVFGLNRRQTESDVALAEAQRYQLEAVYLTLTSNLVLAVVNEASIRAQIQATEEIVRVERGVLDILRKQQQLGQIAALDVLSQEAITAQAEATLPPLVKQLGQQRDLLAALSGSLSNEAVPESFTLEALHLPEQLPLSLPSKLVEQRPDIKQAEANLHASSALVGVAVANRLPLLNLTAQGGSQANALNGLFKSGTGFWTLAGSVMQPIFDGGALLHRERGARAALEQAAAQYRSTVISAFQNVADSLQALKADADTVRLATVASRTADAALKITQDQLRLGQVSYLAQLNAQQTALQARLTLVQAVAARLSDTAALIQALGGGWWNRTDVAIEDARGDNVPGLVGAHSSR